jgi:hypothetical protein
MKRDMDLIREILLFAEEHIVSTDFLQNISEEVFWKHVPAYENHPWYIIEHHVELLENQGYLEKHQQTLDPGHLFGHLTWQGHEFLDSIRDPEIWRKTKDTAERAGGFTVSILGGIAKGLIKTKIKEHTGVEV